jgi:hypothetical protein
MRSKMTIKISVEAETAYQFFVEAVANRSERSFQEVMTETSLEEFLTDLDGLHHRYLAGEFSIGRMAEIVGLSLFQLDYVLNLLGFPTPD